MLFTRRRSHKNLCKSIAQKHVQEVFALPLKREAAKVDVNRRAESSRIQQLDLPPQCTSDKSAYLVNRGPLVASADGHSLPELGHFVFYKMVVGKTHRVFFFCELRIRSHFFFYIFFFVSQGAEATRDLQPTTHSLLSTSLHLHHSTANIHKYQHLQKENTHTCKLTRMRSAGMIQRTRLVLVAHPSSTTSEPSRAAVLLDPATATVYTAS